MGDYPRRRSCRFHSPADVMLVVGCTVYFSTLSFVPDVKHSMHALQQLLGQLYETRYRHRCPGSRGNLLVTTVVLAVEELLVE